MNGCKNATLAEGYWAQDGWEVVEVDGIKLRIPRAVWVTNVMSTDCRYDFSSTDSGCDGCNENT